jgi:hypothetical protein
MPGKWLDYGARFYDAQIGRWHSVDPLAEAFISFTPYHYVRNNPVKLYDINGMGDNDWFDKQQEIDANYNAQNDAMFNSIMTGPALGKTQTAKNTDEKKKKNKGEATVDAISGADFEERPQIGDEWCDGLPVIYRTNNSLLVVSFKTGKYIDIMDDVLKREFDELFRKNKKSSEPYWSPVSDNSLQVGVFSALGAASNPLIGLKKEDFPYLSILRPDVSIFNIKKSVEESVSNYRGNLQLKRLHWYTKFNIIK